MTRSDKPWQHGGTYLITGGAGALGQMFAREIAAHVSGVKLVLAGRGVLGEAQQRQLQELREEGAQVRYLSLDVSDRESVERAVRDIREQHGDLTGVIHSAGLIRDSFLLKKTEEELRSVFAGKVAGVVNLDEATARLKLDFFIVFSSSAGVFGNVGQGDYATANAFLDEYMRCRARWVEEGLRHGRSISINWPLWVDGGMKVDAATQAWMSAQGLQPLSGESGMQAFYQAYASGRSQVVVVSKRSQAQAERRVESARAAGEHPAGTQDPILEERTLRQLTRLFADVSKVNATKLDVQEPFESYGIDSIMITQLNQRLGEVFGELSKTLFYEYPTLRELNHHLVSQYRVRCARWCGLQSAAKTAQKHRADPARRAPVTPRSAKKPGRAASRTARDAAARDSIAIIGLSGRYPQARTLEQYWENLRNGKDCIEEIPADRWTLDGFYCAEVEPALQRHESYCKWGGFIEGFSEFDPLFFNISPLDAESMDPQERIFMQSCWEALEDAGYTRETLASRHSNRVGVFAGITKTGFDLYGPPLWQQGASSFPKTSFSSLANRVSYFLNLHGPSMPVDTMCSASLTAIHEACEHLLREECELAFAGGVNLYLHPSNYIELCRTRMLSTNGRCKSFGEGGDGFVPGEGVGVILLKRLSRAIDDRDVIHGVIRATQINHGGKTNGYTVPNPNSQRELVRAALRKAGIDARAISYIEAHGTGTSLGDPIEITGLTQAFEQDTADKQFCALGSAKSNIGHLEAAAGIAAVTKVLLQMKHRTLVPSLHADVLNPNLRLDETPFVVQRQLAHWHRPTLTVNGQTAEYPRIAGVSSFGAGGSNAHVIVEEYPPAPRDERVRAPAPGHPALIVLSARNEERLKEQAANLRRAVDQRAFDDADLSDIAYTLQVGREGMEHRLAFTAISLEELRGKLDAYLAGMADKDGIDGFYRGTVRREKGALSFTADEDIRAAIATWVEKRKYDELLDLWVRGLTFDWRQLHAVEPRRISLPTYPFARDRHWPKSSATGAPRAPTSTAHTTSVLHPLVQRNDSRLDEQRFSSTFTGEEFYLSDHVVKGSKVLPGVCYLEMARVAASASLGQERPHGRQIALKNVVWMQPIVVEAEPREVHIGVYADESGEIGFEVYTVDPSGASEEGEIVHAQGRVVRSQASAGETHAPPAIDIGRLREQCARSIGPERCYDAFRASGLEYGAAHRGLTSIQLGKDGSGEEFVLAEVRLPGCVADTAGMYELHPSVLDGALQAVAALGLDAWEEAVGSASAVARALLPFALETLETWGSTPEVAWVHVRRSATRDDGKDGAGRVERFDIDVCTENGEVRAGLRGFTARVLRDSQAPEAARNGPVRVAGENQTPQLSRHAPPARTDESDDGLLHKIQSALIQAISRQLKVQVEDIDVDVELGEFGFDSIRFTTFANDLNEAYGIELRPTVFFDYPTVSEFARYLAQSHCEALAAKLAVREPGRAAMPKQGLAQASAVSAEAKSPPAAGARKRRSRRVALDRQDAHVESVAAHEPIAIIGMSGCFPGAADLRQFWQNLKDGKDCITEIPRSRWDWRAWYGDPTREANRTNVKWGGFIEGVDEFDPLFFGISPREAEMMDPQQRLLMTHVWKAIEDAGYSAQSLSGSQTGIFVGTDRSGYSDLIAQAHIEVDGHRATGTVSSVGPNRMSYHLNLHGPSEPVETACSSSLIAIHRAIRAMRSGECDMALVGGINTIVTPWAHISFSRAGMLCEDGRCKTFAKSANGYVRGEGVGMLFLKPLSAAARDADHIYALIRGSATNHGGRANSLTAPNPNAQAQVLKAAYRDADVEPGSLSYIEAHGTGTPLGDPIEINALKSVFAEARARAPRRTHSSTR